MFDYAITTPASTSKASPSRTDLPLDKGVIDLVQVEFPPGPQGLLHVVIERGGGLLWPRNEGEGFASDRFTIEFRPFLELSAAPLSLTAVTWNEDDTFSHQVHIRINLVPPEVVFPPSQEIGILRRIERLLTGRRARS